MRTGVSNKVNPAPSPQIACSHFKPVEDSGPYISSAVLIIRIRLRV